MSSMNNDEYRKMRKHMAAAEEGHPVRLRRKLAEVEAVWVPSRGDKHYGDYEHGHWLVSFGDGRRVRMNAERLYEEFEPVEPAPPREDKP